MSWIWLRKTLFPMPHHMCLDSLCLLKDLVSILPIAVTCGDLINIMRIVTYNKLPNLKFSQTYEGGCCIITGFDAVDTVSHPTDVNKITASRASL